MYSKNFTYTGRVTITFSPLEKIKEIILHANILEVQEVDLKITIFSSLNTSKGLLNEVDSKNEKVSSKNKRSVLEQDYDEDINETSSKIIPVNLTSIKNEDLSANTPEVTPTQLPQTKTESIRMMQTIKTESLEISNKIFNESNSRFIIKLKDYITPYKNYTLDIIFSGFLSNNFKGFYKTAYLDEQGKIQYNK